MKKQATKIKICGLTKEKEADYLNQIHADFAGMVVFFPKSKRNISLDQAKKIKSALLPEIKTVAVTVSPTLAQISQIAEAGFDLIQIHGDPADLDIKTAKSICEYTSKFSLPSSLLLRLVPQGMSSSDGLSGRCSICSLIQLPAGIFSLE